MRRAAPYLVPALPLLWLWRGVLGAPASLLPTNPYGDLPSRFSPLREFGFSELAAGRLPLWNPRILGGVPNLGGAESALLYPPSWLHLTLPHGAALNALLFLHLWLGAALAAFWARRLGAARAGAALAGLAWMLGGTVFPRLYAGHLTVLCALAWAPLVYAGVDGWLKEREPRWLAAGAAASALQLLAGSPQTAYYTALGAGLYGALILPWRREGALRLAAGVAGLFALAAGLSAAQLLPSLEAARESARAGSGYGFAASFSLPPESLLTLVVPHWLGGGELPYFGRLYLWEASLFCGSAAALLAAACPKPHRRPLWLGASLLLVLALGARLPLHRLLYEALPGFALFRGAGKFSAQAALLLCVAAGLGLGALSSEAERRRSAALGVWAALALTVLAALSWPAAAGRLFGFLAASGETFADPELYGDLSFRGAAIMSAIRGFFAAAALFALSSAALRAGRPGLVAAAAAAELLLFAQARLSVAPVRQHVPEALAEALASDPGDYRFLVDWTRHPNLGMVVGRDEAWGYDQLPLRRWAELAAWTQGRGAAEAGLYQRLDDMTPRLAALRVRYVLKEGAPPLLLRSRPELPRAFLAWPRRSGAGGDLETLGAPGFDLLREAAWTGAPEAAARPGRPGGDVTLRELSTDALQVEARAEQPCLLVVADAFSSGWRAEALPGSDRASYEVVPVDHALRGVPLSPGRHRLRLVYEPATWRAGLFLSAVSLLLLLALARNSLFAQVAHKH